MILISKAKRLTHQIIMLFSAGFIASACDLPLKGSPQTSSPSLTEPLKKTDPKTESKTESKPDQVDELTDYPDAKLLRTQYMLKPILYSGFRAGLATINSVPSNYYMKMVPKATIFADYNSGNDREIFLSADFAWPFEKNLPSEILQELEKRNLRNNKSVDIAWVIQNLENIGGNSNGATKNITYLKAHGWSDPDAILPFLGDRVKRNFLYGIFDADSDISHEVKLSTMAPFLIYTHDSVYSPQTAAVKLPSDQPDSMALWSLVIGDPDPERKVKAIATLHWLISKKDREQFVKESTHEKTIRTSDPKTTQISGEIKFATIGAYISMLTTTSSFKDTSLVKKLQALIKP